jgi:HAD superfamily hydrolase (TIGR01484 family)
MARTVIFTDLDDTLIQTQGKVPEHALTLLGATDKNGYPLSFFTQSQKMMLGLFEKSGAIIIPVTGRNTDALNRVVYEFDNYRAVSHGAVVLKDKELICDNWLNEIGKELDEWRELMQICNLEIQQTIDSNQLDARTRVIIDQNVPAYISIKGKEDALSFIKGNNRFGDKFRRHENGRNHALLPPYASKKKAVEYIMKRLELDVNDLIVGVGDSLSDLEFMQSCQFAMLPNNSQIANKVVYV